MKLRAKNQEPDLSTFGQEGGLEVDQKEDILPQVDKLLGCKSVLEFFFVEPCRPVANETMLEKFTQYSYGWGHAAVRYKLDGQDYVVNMANPTSGFADFVSFVTPAEYLFSTSTKAFRASEQYGIYGRSYQILRIEEGGVPESMIRKMHDYYTQLSKRADNNEVVWASTPFHLYTNCVKRFLGLTTQEGGGCADWISRGLAEGGFISRSKRFPKAIWTSLMKNYCHLRKEGKLHMVSIRRAKHAKMHISYTGYTVDDEDESLHSHKGPTSWLHWLSTIPHWNLENYADVVVACPESTKITITPKESAPYTHFKKDLMSVLLRLEFEPWVIGFTLLKIYNFSFWLYLGITMSLFYACKQTGHFLAFDTVTAFVTMLAVAPLCTISNYLFDSPTVLTIMTCLVFALWFRLFYYWAS